MTVKELMEFLNKYPDDFRVVVNGYEDGYDDILPERISTTKIELDVGKHDWEGQHGGALYGDDTSTDDTKIVDALVFCRAPYY